MSLPPTNTTCDVYRGNRTPPDAPDAAAVPCLLTGDFGAGAGPSSAALTEAAVRWTHVMLVAAAVDVRDGFNLGAVTPGNADRVYVPDRNGTPFQVAFVEKTGAPGVKRVYLLRGAAPWPTSHV